MSKLLLIIDMQEGFRSEESENIIPKIKTLMKDFKGKIVFSVFKNKKGSQFEKILKWKRFQDKKDVEVLKELQNKKLEKIEHIDYKVINAKVNKYMKTNNIKEVYLTGVFTDVCISKAAMDLFDGKISVKIIKDACVSLHGKKHHNTAIETMEKVIGKKNVVLTNKIIY